MNSVQDLIQNFEFAEREEDAESPGAEESGEKTEEEQRSHYSIRNCKNYGTITAEFRRDDDARKHTQVAGICAELYKGCLYHCASLGTVRFDSDAPDRSEDGWVYTNQPMAIAEIMGFAPVEEHHIVDCVSHQGMIDSPMRHENVMEITIDQIALWEEGALPYISNNWQFDLEEAIKLCALESLEIEESELSKEKDETCLCQEFFLNLPKGFVIREMKVGGVCYGLKIRYEGKDEAYSDYETWLIRKTADIDQALEEVRTSNSPDEWRIRSFVEKVYDTLTASHMWNIDSINLPFYGCYSLTTGPCRQNYLEDGLSSGKLNLYMQEGDHCLGNLASMPLEGSQEDGLEAKWIFVFTNHETNIRPSAQYIDTIKEYVYLLDGSSACVQAEPGDNLWKLAEVCTGDGANYLWLANRNHMTVSDPLYVGDLVLLPDYERWEQRQNQIGTSYLHE